MVTNLQRKVNVILGIDFLSVAHFFIRLACNPGPHRAHVNRMRNRGKGEAGEWRREENVRPGLGARRVKSFLSHEGCPHTHSKSLPSVW